MRSSANNKEICAHKKNYSQSKQTFIYNLSGYKVKILPNVQFIENISYCDMQVRQ